MYVAECKFWTPLVCLFSCYTSLPSIKYSGLLVLMENSLASFQCASLDGFSVLLEI